MRQAAGSVTRRVRGPWLLAAALFLAAGDASAQEKGMEMVPLQGLSFGTLIPGVPEQVGVHDGARRAEVALSGWGVYDLSLILPAALESPAGRKIPLRFGAGDAAVAATTSTVPAVFNPRHVHRIRLGREPGSARLLLGGTALPAADQAAGRYRATLVLVVTPPGT